MSLKYIRNNLLSLSDLFPNTNPNC